MSQVLVASLGRYYTYAIKSYPPAQPLNTVQDLNVETPAASSGLSKSISS